MKKNMGKMDRIIRLIVAAALVFLYFTNVITGTIGIIGLVVAGIFVITSFVTFCPIYWGCGISSRPSTEE
jgi:hypothetical protein